MNCSQKDVLNIKDLSIRYVDSKTWVLEGLNLKLGRGERLALIGSSGSGKSTFAKVLLQIIPSGSFCRGELLLNGVDLMSLSHNDLEKLRGEMIGLVFQDPGSRLNPLMTIGEHLLDTLRAHQPDQSSSWMKNRSEELLEKVGINPLRFDAYPHEFSGGMRQRVAIALAIALNPPLIIADEPTSSLDVAIAHQIMGELSNLCDEIGSSLLLISHDLALASRWCQKMAILDEGKIVEEGYTHKILTAPKSLFANRLINAARAREDLMLLSEPTQEVVLEVESLRCWHPVGGVPWRVNWLKAINEVSFVLKVGETLGIVGVSGCGKSTLCRALLGLLPTRGGQVKLLGKNLENLKGKALKVARQSVQMVFQDPFASLNPKMNVLETVADPLLIHNITSRVAAKERARDLLKQVGLFPVENFQKRFPHQLSGGQQQRVAIARALALNPKILLCDESVSMLDAEIQADILNLLRSLQEKLGLAIIFITHDLSVASSFCHRVIVLDQGRIAEEGPADQIIRSPKSVLARKLVSASPRIISIN
ncbi:MULTISPECIES: ABC transporter ATP-binding protein [Prochlorococcus]|nr:MULTISPECIES: ABC transporter ATP-binding protein [Prochlorococcus]KGG11466.1 Cell division transporter [Prochlorococcus marinus str. LG]KGG32728.1 Cell division transporter [Prochlorococcus marinus str. SS51]